MNKKVRLKLFKRVSCGLKDHGLKSQQMLVWETPKQRLLKKGDFFETVTTKLAAMSVDVCQVDTADLYE
jgi:hypothetical protein